MVSTSVRLPKDLLEWLRENTDNRNNFIVEAIREKIEAIAAGQIKLKREGE